MHMQDTICKIVCLQLNTISLCGASYLNTELDAIFVSYQSILRKDIVVHISDCRRNKQVTKTNLLTNTNGNPTINLTIPEMGPCMHSGFFVDQRRLVLVT